MIKQYIYLQFKNCIEIIKKNLICLLCIITVLTVALAAVNFVMGQNIDNSFIKVGIVNDEDNSEIKALMRYISHESSIEKIASFEYLDHNEAFSELSASNLNIVIDIPKNYYQNIDTGINTPLDIYVNDNSDIIYEDKDIIVINKPCKLLCVSTEKEKEKTLFYNILQELHLIWT